MCEPWEWCSVFTWMDSNFKHLDVINLIKGTHSRLLYDLQRLHARTGKDYTYMYT